MSTVGPWNSSGLSRGPTYREHMKIVTNIQTKSVGGIGRVMSSLAAYIRREGVPIELVGLAVSSDLTGGAPELQWEPYDDGTFRGWAALMPAGFWKQTLARSPSFDSARTALAPLVAAYADRLRAEKPDLVLINGTYFRPWCLLTAARSLGIPVVIYYHGSAVLESAGAEGDAALSIVTAIEKDFADAHARYIFPSRLAQEQAMASFLLPTHTSVVIPNSVPDAFFAATGAHEPRAVGIVARWEPIKNTSFIASFAAFNAAAASPYEIRMISDLLPGQEPPLHAAHFSFSPSLGITDLATFYRRASAVLCPSVFETFGNVAAESVASGTPALVSAASGIAEVFDMIGLQRLITSFTAPAAVCEKIDEVTAQGISEEERGLLRREIGEGVTEARVCGVLTGASIA